jgi:tripartite-type tricarboxylate transporter receptor subunit TctC
MSVAVHIEQQGVSMKFLSHAVLRAVVVAISALLAPGVWAQVYPTKAIRFIVPFAPGGGTDLLGRIIAQRLTETLGQPVVVENRGGAGGVIGAEMVAKAAPDGYTLLLGSPGPLTINPNLQSKTPYDSLKDFAPVSLGTISPFVLLVHPSMPAKSVKDLIALAKARPAQLNFGSAGNGSVAHLAAEQFKSLAGINLVHIPYKGSAPAVIDLLAGQLQLHFENLPVVQAYIKAGRVRALAVGTRQRSTFIPELPTMEQAGVPGYEASTAFGVLVPARTPREIVARLNADIVKALTSPDVKERLLAQGLEPAPGTPEQYATHLRNELETVARIVKMAGIKME